MSIEMTLSAYETKLGNPVAKSILALIADQMGPDGYGVVPIGPISKRAELSASKVQCLIRVFEEIGLLEREAWCDPATGKLLKIAIQFSLKKLGTDLRKEFNAAFSKVQAKVSPAT